MVVTNNNLPKYKLHCTDAYIIYIYYDMIFFVYAFDYKRRHGKFQFHDVLTFTPVIRDCGSNLYVGMRVVEMF